MSTPKVHLWIAVATVMAAGATMARADSVTLVDQFRFVRVDAYAGAGGYGTANFNEQYLVNTNSAYNYGVFDHSVSSTASATSVDSLSSGSTTATTSMYSTIVTGPTSAEIDMTASTDLSGTGTGDVIHSRTLPNPNQNRSSSFANYWVTFSITQAHSYVLTIADFANNIDQAGLFDWTGGSYQGTIVSHSNGIFTGTLQAGTYRVTGLSHIEYPISTLPSSDALTVNLSLTALDSSPVPEPASLAVLALGGMALLVRRRQ